LCVYQGSALGFCMHVSCCDITYHYFHATNVGNAYLIWSSLYVIQTEKHNWTYIYYDYISICMYILPLLYMQDYQDISEWTTATTTLVTDRK
jgi:hypothetical protein